MFSPNDKKPGDVILSADWNASMQEVARLETDKVNRQGQETLAGPLTIEEALTIKGPTGIGKDPDPDIQLDIAGKGGETVDLQVNGRLKSNSDDGGLWISDNRFVGGFEDKLGLWNGEDWQLTVQKDGNVGIGTTHPKVTLEVAGDISSGPLYENKNTHRIRNLSITIQARVSYALDYSEESSGIPVKVKAVAKRFRTDPAAVYMRVSSQRQQSDTGTANQPNNTGVFSSYDLYTTPELEAGLNTLIFNPKTGYKQIANHNISDNRDNWNRWADWILNNAEFGDIVSVFCWDKINTVPLNGSAENLLTSILATEWVNIKKSTDNENNFQRSLVSRHSPENTGGVFEIADVSGQSPWNIKQYSLFFVQGRSTCDERLFLPAANNTDARIVSTSYYPLLK
ncbi:MAG: hypothetical protein AB8B99_14370 [Phormidesmis sp.]